MVLSGATDSSRTFRLWHSGLALPVLGVVVAVIGVLQTTEAAVDASCPSGTELVAKFEYRSGGYSFADGDAGVVTISGDAEGGTWSSTTPIAAVVVKGGTQGVTTRYDPPSTGGRFTGSNRRRCLLHG